MRAEFLALGAAVTFGANNFLMGIGMRHSTPAMGATISVFFNGLFLWLFFWRLGMRSPWLWAPVLLFILGGFCSPGAARFCNYRGFQRIGPANAVSLAAASPLFAAILAVLVLGEGLTWAIGLGTVSVVTGTIIISRTGRTVSNWRKRDMVWPLMAGLLFASRDVIVRYGLREYHEPVLAAALSVATSFVILLGWQGLSRDFRGFTPSRRNLPYFVVAAVLVTASYILMFSAFSVGQVVIVTPLVGVHPLATIGLTLLFLRKTEVVTWRTVAGAMLIIAGAVVIGAGGEILRRLQGA
ncbi:MAG: DMT family transporter [Candidatus Tectomicrobia bacterium]|nr:DMT family transporter [Candidatus Tectomicrobia bacterium]